MFVPLDTAAETLRPASSRISPSDWAILSNYWYAIAREEDIGQDPAKACLLDVELVIFRDAAGDVVTGLDRCPHRHVRLSRGRVVEGEIECPFHGLRFNGKGLCTHVPALGREARLPAGYRYQSFPVQIKYGLVWTCLGDPALHDLPSLPAFDDVPPSEITYGPVRDWQVSAPRQIENFFDLAHLPFVHALTLGGKPERGIKPGRIEDQPDGLILHAEYMETAPDGSDRLGLYRYRIILPFLIDFQVEYPGHPEHRLVSSDIATPVSAYVSRVFQLHRVPGGRAAGQSLVDMLETVNEEDRIVLSDVTLPDLPLAMNREIHLPVDKVSEVYRSRLRALGLGRG